MSLRRLAMLAALLWLGTTPVRAEHWVESGRDSVRGEAGTVYLDLDVQSPRAGYAKFRAKFVFDAVQTNPVNTLKYKEIRSSFEANCTTLKIQHLLSTMYGPQGGVQFQVEGDKIQSEPDVKTARRMCDRLR
jgi:hypothetical protein